MNPNNIKVKVSIADIPTKEETAMKGGEIKIPSLTFITIDPITGEYELTVYTDDGEGNGVAFFSVELNE